jgi:hypothetical protein
MRPLSTLIGVLLVAFSVFACTDTPVDPMNETAALEAPMFAKVPAVLCSVSPGVLQKVKGKRIVVTGTVGGDAINCAISNLRVEVDAREGNDLVVGGPFDDDLKGGPDCDRVSGGPGNDVVDGGSGNDGPSDSGGCTIPNAAPYSGLGIFLPAEGALRGGPGDDTIIGGSGDDSMTGQDGTDVCEGGPGFDHFSSSCEVQDQGPA